MNEESRSSLVTFIAHVAMLGQAIRKDATRDQITARLEQLHADAAALAETLTNDDRDAADAVKDAWEQPAKALARSAARVKPR